MPMPNNNDLEARILAVAKDLFVKKGFDETSMSDIAVAAGITRPALHYYFRTKERMFQAVFGGILESLAPSIEEILDQDTTAMEKISRLVDTYTEKFIQEPSLPLFIMMEIQRDAGHLVETASHVRIMQYASRVAGYFRSEMDKGNINRVPFYPLFYTFFGLISYPFLTRNLLDAVSGTSGSDFEAVMRSWKRYVVFHLGNLLEVHAGDSRGRIVPE